MLENKKDIVVKTDFFIDRVKNRRIANFIKGKKITFVVGILLGFLLVLTVYLSLDISNIYHINVKGNYYLSDEEIIDLTNLNTNKKFYLFTNKSIENKVSKSDFINECKVEKLNGNLVLITVKEKKIVGYTYTSDKNVFVLEDNETIDITKDNIHIINKVPLISGFNEEELILLEKNLSKCDEKIINEISDIVNYPKLKYQSVELIMRDGNYIFTSYYGLDILNKYYSIESSYSQNKKTCYYFEDISGNAYSSACPWENVSE